MHNLTHSVVFVYTGHGKCGVHHFGQEEVRAGGVARRRTQVGPPRASFRAMLIPHVPITREDYGKLFVGKGL